MYNLRDKTLLYEMISELKATIAVVLHYGYSSSVWEFTHSHYQFEYALVAR